VQETEELSPEQLRKVRHLKLAFLVMGALVILALLPVLLSVGAVLLALAVFAFAVMLFFFGCSRLLDRLFPGKAEDAKESS